MKRVYLPYKTRAYLSRYKTSTNFYKPSNNYNRNNRNIVSSQIYNKNKFRTKNNLLRNNLNSGEPIIRENINITNINYQPYKDYIDNEIDLLNLKMRCDLISHKLNRIKYYLNDDNNNINLNQININMIEGFKNKSEYNNEEKYNFNNEDIVNNINDDKIGNINNIYLDNNNQKYKNQNILDKNNDQMENDINNNVQITNNYLSINNKDNNIYGENNIEYNKNNENYNDRNNSKQENNKMENKNEIDLKNSPYEIKEINQDRNLLKNNDFYRAFTFGIDKNQNDNGMKEELLKENQNNLNLKNGNIEELKKNEIQNDKYEFKKNNLKNYKHAKKLFEEMGNNTPMNIYNLYINNEDSKDELNNKKINNSGNEFGNNSFDKFNNINKNDAKEIMNNLENNKKYFNSYLEKMNNIDNINKFDEIDDKYMNEFNEKNDENNEDGNVNNINNSNKNDIFNEMENDQKNIINKSRNINKTKENEKLEDNNNIDKNNEIKENLNKKFDKKPSKNRYLNLMEDKENSFNINAFMPNNDNLKNISINQSEIIINSSINKSKGKNNNTYNNSIKQKYKKILPTSNLYNYNNIVSKDKNKDNRENRYKTIVIKDKERNKNSINDNDKFKKNYNNKRAKSKRNYNNDILNKLKLLDLQTDENPKSNKLENAIDDDFLNQLRLNRSEDNIKLIMNKEEIESLIDKDKEKLMRYDPIRRNIEMIKNIESYKKQGIVFPGIKRERKVREAPLKYCYKFRLDPQKFYSEILCDSMYEALDFKIIKNNK